MRRTAVLFALSAIGCHGSPAAEAEPPPVVVRCIAPRREATEETLALRGRVEPPPGGDLPVASQVPGRVVSLAAREGQRVARGDVVATVDDAAARDAARQADAEVAQARGQETNALATLARAREAVRRGIAAQQELDDAVAREQAARSGVGVATSAADLAHRTLGRVTVRSSFDGVITHVWRGPGALVDGTAATPIVQLAASGATEFVAEATERELARLQVGQGARGTLASDATFRGSVRLLATALDSTTGLGTVRVAMDESSGTIPLGAFGRVEIAVAHHDAALLLPVAALRGAVADGAEVAVCAGGHTELRKVTVGWRDAARFEARQGLGPTDRVAIDHVLGLENGTVIQEVR